MFIEFINLDQNIGLNTLENTSGGVENMLMDGF